MKIELEAILNIGVIEGFFGRSWSWENRRNYANFLKECGYRFYIYAPKDDAFLRKRWDELWPREWAEKMEALVHHYQEADVQFGMGLSPYEIYLNYDAEAKTKLQKKMDELNSIDPGVLKVLNELLDTKKLTITVAGEPRIVKSHNDFRLICTMNPPDNPIYKGIESFSFEFMDRFDTVVHLDYLEPDLEVVMMCEIPSNAINADEFLNLFDGFSIGSNDLTQLTLGMDRDSEKIAGIGDERDPAVLKLIVDVIHTCVKRKKYVGICGQAPSDFPFHEFGERLVDAGISSISLNPDKVVEMILKIAEKEDKG